MALVDDDEVEELYGHLPVVFDRWHFLGCPAALGGILLFGRVFQFLSLEDGVEPLDGADIDVVILGDIRGRYPVDAVERREAAVVVVRLVCHEFLLGLLPEVLRVYEEEDTLRVRVLEEAVDEGDGRKGFPRPRGHLNEGSGLIRFEGRLELRDRVDLAIAQAFGQEIGRASCRERV